MGYEASKRLAASCALETQHPLFVQRALQQVGAVGLIQLREALEGQVVRRVEEAVRPCTKTNSQESLRCTSRRLRKCAERGTVVVAVAIDERERVRDPSVRTDRRR